MKPSLRLVYWFARRKFFMSVALGGYYIAMERLAWEVPYANWVFAAAGLFVIPEGLADVLRALKGRDSATPWHRDEDPPPSPPAEDSYLGSGAH